MSNFWSGFEKTALSPALLERAAAKAKNQHDRAAAIGNKSYWGVGKPKTPTGTALSNFAGKKETQMRRFREAASNKAQKTDVGSLATEAPSLRRELRKQHGIVEN